MRVVITGGSGLVGRALVDELVGHGHAPVVLSRRPEAVEGLPAGAQAAGWSGDDPEALARTLDGADAVVHLAGASIADGRWTAARKRAILESRTQTSATVAEAIGRAGAKPRVLVQASAVGYYGPGGDRLLTESSPPGDDFLARVCVAWEEASAGVAEHGVRRAVARTGVVLATDGGALPKMMLPFKLFAGGPAGSGSQWMPWIHIADEAAALRFLLEHDAASGPFNLTAPEPLTNRDFSRELGRAMGRPSLLPAPAFALKLALGEMSTVVLDGQRAVPQRLLEAGFSFRFETAAAALSDLLD